MMRKIYFLICLFIASCIGSQAFAAKKYKLDFDGRNSWFYIISDGTYLTWDPTQDVLMLTDFTSSLNSQWTLDRDGHLYNRAKGEKYTIGSKKQSVASLVRNGKAVLRNGYISCEIKDYRLYLGVSSDGMLMFGGKSALIFMMHPAEITPQKTDLTDSIVSSWEERYRALRKEINGQWSQDYDLAQFGQPLIFKAPERNTPVNELARRAPEIIAKAQEYADNGKRGSWVYYSLPGDEWDAISRSVILDRDFVRYSDGYYVCRPIVLKNFSAPKFLSWPGEDYTYGSNHCLSKPISMRTYEISRNRWIIRYEEQVQVKAESSGKGDASVLHPEEVLKRYTDIYQSLVPKTGTYSTTYELWGIPVPAKATCSREYWQTYRVGRPDCPWEQKVLGPIHDPFAPWRIKQTMVIEFNINDYLKQFDSMPKELAALHLLDKALEFSSAGWQGKCIPIAVLETYSKELGMFTKERIWQQIEKSLSARQIKRSVMFAIACPDNNALEHVCEKIFTSCKTPDELLDAFSEVYDALYGESISTEHFASYAFAGLTWPGFHPMRTEKEQVPSYFTHYIEKRDELFSDYGNVVIKDNSYSLAFYSYLFNLLAYNKTYDPKMLAKVQTCSNRKFCSDIRALLPQIVIYDLQVLVSSYSKSGDIENVSNVLEQLDNIVNSGLIDKPSDYHLMREKVIADVSKLLSVRLMSVFNNFDSNWLNRKFFDISPAVAQLTRLVELNSVFYKGALLGDDVLKECEFRIDAYQAMIEADEYKFIDKWGGNNLYVDGLNQRVQEQWIDVTFKE